jgi:hypothetical protein
VNPDTLFGIANFIALAGWLTLVGGVVTAMPLLRDRVAGLWIPLALALAYTVIILVHWWSAEGGFDTLANVQRLFASPWIALAGWVHYLAYDLAIGAWLSRQIMERGLSRLLLIPVLPLAFLFGPIGFVLAHLILHTRKGMPS